MEWGEWETKITVAQTNPLELKDSTFTKPQAQTWALLLVNQALYVLTAFPLSPSNIFQRRKKKPWPTVYLSTLMFSLYFGEASMGTWRIMHVLKGTHICCALGAGRQQCYWGPNLIFSLFWSSTFNHWLLGGSAFPKKLFKSRKKMLLQHVYGIIHVRRNFV